MDRECKRLGCSLKVVWCPHCEKRYEKGHKGGCSKYHEQEKHEMGDCVD